MRKPHFLKTLLGGVALVSALIITETAALAQTERDYVRLVGSRRVYPYISPVVERFGAETRFKFPEIIISNANAGQRLLCAGLGLSTADITIVTVPLTDEERFRCSDNQAGTIVELTIGYDTVVAAVPKSDDEFTISAIELFLALAKRIPDPSASDPDSAVSFVKNNYLRWDQLNKELPKKPIRILIPPRNAFETDLILKTLFQKGCDSIAAIAALKDTDPVEYQAICSHLREDSVIEEFVGSGEELAMRFDRIQAGLGAKEIEDETLYQFYADSNPPLPLVFTRPHGLKGAGDLIAISIDEISPIQRAITSGDYLLSRPVYLRIKADHMPLVPGMRDLIANFLSEDAISENGYLVEHGLTPLLRDDRKSLGARLTTAIQLSADLEQAKEQKDATTEIPPEEMLKSIEQSLWDVAQAQGTLSNFELYAKLFPKGVFVERALDRIEELKFEGSTDGTEN